MKKIISVFLAVLLTVCCLPLSSLAATIAVDQAYLDAAEGGAAVLGHVGENDDITEYRITTAIEFNSNFTNITVDKGASLTVAAGLTVPVNCELSIKGEAVFAGNVTVNGTLSVEAGAKLTIGGNTVINEGGRFVIKNKNSSVGSVLLDYNSALDVYGTLEVNGTLSSLAVNDNTGNLVIKAYQNTETGEWKFGKVLNPQNIGGNSTKENYHYYAEVVFDSLPELQYKNTNSGTVSVWNFNKNAAFGHYVSSAQYACSYNGSSYSDLNSADTVWNNIWNDGKFSRGMNAAKRTVNLNQYLYFKCELKGLDGSKEDIDRYDSSLIPFEFNNVSVENVQGVNKMLVTSAGVVRCSQKPHTDAEYKDNTIRYKSDSSETTEEYFLKMLKIYIPNGTGYEVYGINGETSGDGETVLLKYGKEFIFKVDIKKDYSNSLYEVYGINTYKWNDNRFSTPLAEVAMYPEVSSAESIKQNWTATDIDEYGMEQNIAVIRFCEGESGFWTKDSSGNYHIPAELMVRDCSIQVSGVAKNETLSFIAKILEMLRNVFNALKRFFHIEA